MRAWGLAVVGTSLLSLAIFAASVETPVPRASTTGAANTASAQQSQHRATNTLAATSIASVSRQPRGGAFIHVVGTARAHRTAARRPAVQVDVLPVVTGVSPTSGPLAGGTPVTVTGTGFTGATDVYFGATDCPIATGCSSFVDDSHITAVTPAGVAGTWDVTVKNDIGTSVQNPPADRFQYQQPAPTITNVNPNAGPTAGGSPQITITGTNFSGPGYTATDLVVGATDVPVASAFPCAGSSGGCFQVTIATSISAFPPAGSGQPDITVKTFSTDASFSQTSSTSSSDVYSYAAAPSVTSVSPSSGPATGGTPVTVAGTGFQGPGFTTTQVSVVGQLVTAACGTAPCFTVNSATSITVDVPAGSAGTGDIRVTTPGGTSSITGGDQYTYLAQPAVTGITPNAGPIAGGNTVAVGGAAFTGATDVIVDMTDVNTTPCPPTPTSPCFDVGGDSQITVKDFPAHAAGTVHITVTTPGGTSPTSSADQYTYQPLPTVTAVSPAAGSIAGGNTPTTVTGTGFIGVSDVAVGSNHIPSSSSPCPGSPTSPCFTVVGATQITIGFFAAHAAGTVDITVTTPNGVSPLNSNDTYAYAPVPTVTKVSPSAGATAGGNSVVVTGTGLASGTNYSTTSVRVGTTACPLTSCYTVNSPTQITITSMPADSAGGTVDIIVTTIGGTSAAVRPNDAYTYVASFPTVTSVSPADGAVAGKATVIITGTNYGTQGSGFAPTDVLFGSTHVTTTPCSTNPTAPCFNAVSATRISVFTPAASAPGPVDVRVITPASPNPSNIVPGDVYTYVAPGTYTALTPTRICDTRSTSTSPCRGRTLGPAITVQVASSGGPVPLNALAVVFNLTAINHSTTATYISAYPAGGTRPLASNISVDPTTTQPNLVIVALSSVGAVTIFNAVGSVDVVVDVEGYFAAPGGSTAGRFHSLAPVRICDTRANMGTACATTANNPIKGGTWRRIVVSGLPPGGTGVGIPTDGTAAAAVFNLTAVAATQATYLSVAPPNSSEQCPATVPASNLNPSAGATLPNRVISKLGPTQDICVFNGAGSVNVIVDVNGWFGNGHETSVGALFYAVTPSRICDTRANTHTGCAGTSNNPLIGGAAARIVQVDGVAVVPAFSGSTKPVALVANLTGVMGTLSTYLELYPSDAAHQPRSSDLNPTAHDVIANLSIVGLSMTAGAGFTTGDVSLYNGAGSINAILDVSGWFQ